MGELYWNDFLGICQSHKPTNFKPPDWEKVKNEIASRLGVENDELLHTKLIDLRDRYFKCIKAKNSKHSAERSVKKEIVLNSEDLNQITPDPVKPAKKRKTKSLDQLGNRQLKNRTDELWSKVQEYADENQETPLRILALLLKQCKDKNARDFGEQVWQQPTTSTAPATEKFIAIDSAIAIMVDCSLGRDTYSKLSKILKQEGHHILPPWIYVRNMQAKISPEPIPLPHPHVGVRFSFEKCMQLTANRILEGIPPSKVPNPAVMNIKYGFDGSGSHAIYKQLKNANTNNIIMSMFCPLNISLESGALVWEQKSPNSALTHRPVALQMGKESVESLQSLAIFNEDQAKLKTEGCKVVVGEIEVPLKVNVVSHMMDMKAAHLYLGLGGAYCDLCDIPRAACHDPERVQEGFEITRNVADLHTLFDDLVQEDGTIYKSRNDYEERAGQTTKPIPTIDNEVKSVQVLHALLRSFDHFMKIAVHLRAGVFEWSESPTSINKQFLVNAKKEIQSHIDNILGERWDFPDGAGKGGTSTTGNTARRILHHGRDIVTQLVPVNYQQIMRQFGQHLSVIIRVFCSGKTVNVKEYKKLCTTLYLFLLRSFPHVRNEPGTWISITPSVHKLLGHSWELIEMNEDCGLKNFDESGLEASNKVLRTIRLKLARKTSQSDNLDDTIRRMWLGSDPKANNVRLKAQPYCKHCAEHGHSSRYCKIKNPILGPLSDDDALFESLTISH